MVIRDKPRSCQHFPEVYLFSTLLTPFRPVFQPPQIRSKQAQLQAKDASCIGDLWSCPAADQRGGFRVLRGGRAWAAEEASEAESAVSGAVCTGSGWSGLGRGSSAQGQPVLVRGCFFSSPFLPLIKLF